MVVTFSKEIGSAEAIVEILGNPKGTNEQVITHYLVETRFMQNGFERKTISDFGLIGAILEQFGGGG
ncbi:MAG TPA: hypothetical protein VK892_04050, partial [Pyrinomonadaceae bacterium]|nr:hypothetical protein [Pyrinomonadaceae bacterium]